MRIGGACNVKPTPFIKPAEICTLDPVGLIVDVTSGELLCILLALAIVFCGGPVDGGREAVAFLLSSAARAIVVVSVGPCPYLSQDSSQGISHSLHQVVSTKFEHLQS